MTTRKKILVAVTNIAKYPEQDRATGLWLAEAVHFVKKMQEAGYDMDYVSPLGGYTPIDPHSLEQADATDWQWYQDHDFMARLGATHRPDELDAADYAAIYYTGGHGTMWDFPEDRGLQALANAIYRDGGYVTAVCHGVVGLLNIQDDQGQPLLQGREVTGFSNEEETLVGLQDAVPFLTEDALKAKGGQYRKAEQPWAEFAVADRRLITGQNPASGGKVAELLLEQLG
ncbi:type 1 glutamine amidotransferase domain-containing protein [Deinococcus sp. SL84]|uniref:type 1 glutamine amidotransferase domain-containing protein n=1 Tax=Deinococcus sp. SL84 TaxID=2994663 RepID=UPI0022764997|nr:type 1 glutamine amidotransferase domain-containing protein [Deinococcus sp. SL84]MCY1702049.1 type 1 glutamine amidotransferase domain-containing protein [Deinococcus sp. SL84]